MRSVYAIVAMAILPAIALASEIREFNISTLERLGNELSHRDEIVSRATHLVLEQNPDWEKVVPQWWISDLNAGGDIVYFIAEMKAEPVAAYKVTIFRDGPPKLEDIHGQSLPAPILLRYKALQTAVKAVLSKLFAVSYNFEVLDDPDGSGFLVYALATRETADEILTGGHYRITVAANGSPAERVDLLSGLIRAKADPGNETVGIGASQLSSNVPVETWLYSSYLYHMPMFVATKDGSVWRIVNGKIHKFTKTELAEMDKEKQKGNEKRK